MVLGKLSIWPAREPFEETHIWSYMEGYQKCIFPPVIGKIGASFLTITDIVFAF